MSPTTVWLDLLLVLVLAFFHLLFGETVPKSMSIYRPERVTAWIVSLVLCFARLARPHPAGRRELQPQWPDLQRPLVRGLAIGTVRIKRGAGKPE